jgi:hypothetical protein
MNSHCHSDLNVFRRCTKFPPARKCCLSQVLKKKKGYRITILHTSNGDAFYSEFMKVVTHSGSTLANNRSLIILIKERKMFVVC